MNAPASPPTTALAGTRYGSAAMGSRHSSAPPQSFLGDATSSRRERPPSRRRGQGRLSSCRESRHRRSSGPRSRRCGSLTRATRIESHRPTMAMESARLRPDRPGECGLRRRIEAHARSERNRRDLGPSDRGLGQHQDGKCPGGAGGRSHYRHSIASCISRHHEHRCCVSVVPPTLCTDPSHADPSCAPPCC